MEDQQQHNLTENDAASYGSAALDPAVYSDGNLDPNVSGSLDSSSTKQPHSQGDVFRNYMLTYGVVKYKPGTSAANKKANWQQRIASGLKGPETKKRKIDSSDEKEEAVYPDSWVFFNLNLASIQLYASQCITLVKHLPAAYAAFNKGDTSYVAIVGQGKTQRITLEVNEYKEKMYIRMKKYFKPDGTEDDPMQDWLYTGSIVSFDPELDNPHALLNFVLTSSSNQ